MQWEPRGGCSRISAPYPKCLLVTFLRAPMNHKLMRSFSNGPNKMCRLPISSVPKDDLPQILRYLVGCSGSSQ